MFQLVYVGDRGAMPRVTQAPRAPDTDIWSREAALSSLWMNTLHPRVFLLQLVPKQTESLHCHISHVTHVFRTTNYPTPTAGGFLTFFF